MHGSMDITGRGIKGTMTVYQAEPDKNLAVIEIEGIGKIESGSNGEIAWENSVLQGPRIKQGDEKGRLSSRWNLQRSPEMANALRQGGDRRHRNRGRP